MEISERKSLTKNAKTRDFSKQILSSKETSFDFKKKKEGLNSLLGYFFFAHSVKIHHTWQTDLSLLQTNNKRAQKEYIRTVELHLCH